jgi:hypothetical protein
MEVKIEFSSAELVDIVRRQYQLMFGDVPEGHTLSAYINYGRLIVTVAPKADDETEAVPAPATTA